MCLTPTSLVCPQIVLCDQLVAYLQALKPKEGISPATNDVQAATAAAPEAGMKLVKRKGEDEEMEAMFAGLGGKSKGKGARKGKKGDKKDDKEPSSARIQHSIETLSSFSKLHVDVPRCIGDISTTVEALKVWSKLVHMFSTCTIFNVLLCL